MKHKYIVEVKTGGLWRTDNQRDTLLRSKKRAKAILESHGESSVRVFEVRVVEVVEEMEVRP